MSSFLQSNKNSILLVFLVVLVIGIVVGTFLITQNNSFSTNSRASEINEGRVPLSICGGMGVGEARCDGTYLFSYVERNGQKICKKVDCDKDCYMKGICQDCVIDKKNGKGNCKKRK